MLWGGVDASCTLIDVGYECFAELHPEMNGRDTQWTIQASAHDCDGGDYYISDATLTNTF